MIIVIMNLWGIVTELWERWFGKVIQGITDWWEGKVHINIAYDTLNIEVPRVGLKPFFLKMYETENDWLMHYVPRILYLSLETKVSLDSSSLVQLYWLPEHLGYIS